MTETRLLFAISCLLAISIGCGQPPSEPHLAQPSPSNIGNPTQIDDASVLTFTEDQLSVVPDADYTVVEAKLPPLDKLKLAKELKVVTGAVKDYSFNETDIYLDPYDKSDTPIFPFVQIQLPAPVLEKSESQVRLSFPGQEIVSKLQFLLRVLQARNEKCLRIRIRILGTDKTKPNNPIQVVLVGTVWESAD